MKITAQQYISNTKSDTSYITVFRHYYDKSDRKVGKTGDIYALINISTEKKTNTERISKFVWDSIVDGYLYSSSQTTNESLKDSIQEGVKKVKDLMANNKELEETGIDISFTIALVKDEGIYVGIFGENEIYTFKKHSLVNVSDILNQKKASTAGITLEKGDLLMVSSPGILAKNEKRFSNFKEKKDFVRSLNAVGETLVGTKALLYFTKGEEKKEETVKKKEKKTVVESFEGIKDGAKNLVKPIARIERIKKPKEGRETLFKDFKEKNKVDEKLSKFKTILSSIWNRVGGFFEKISVFVSEKWDILKEKVVNNVGKKRWYKKIGARLSEINLGKKKTRGVEGMKIDNYKTRDLRSKRFKILFMFLTITILLILGVNFTVRTRKAREISKEANEVFEQVEELLRKSEDNFVTDRASAETYLYQAEKLMEDVPEELGDSDTENFDELRSKILEVGDSLYRRIGFVEGDGRFENFIDARLAFGEGTSTVDMASYRDQAGNEFLVVADKGRKTIYRVSLYDRSVRAIPDNDGLIKEPQFVYVGGEGVYVWDERGGMLKAAFNEEGWFTAFTSLSGLGTREVRAEDIAEMVVWYGENIYFLSKDRGALLRSSAIYADRYGLPYSFLEHESMNNATHVIADLSVYIVTTEEPYIVRFNYSYFESRFYEAPLGIIGFDGNFGKLTRGFTDDSMEYGLYFFDAEKRIFFRFQKPIEAGEGMRHPNQISLINQYVYRGEKDPILDSVKEFVVDKAENSMYVLDGSVIWKVVL
jgi:hypothetical protein